MALELMILLAAPFGGAASFALYRQLPIRRLSLEGWIGGATVRSVPPSDFIPFRGWSRRGMGRGKAFIEILAVLIAFWAVLIPRGDAPLITACLGWVLLTLAALDLRHRLLPDALTLPLALAGLAVAPIVLGGGTLHHLVGAVLGGLTFWAVATLSRALTGRDGLGLGDAKLFMAAGAWVGWTGLPSVLLLGALGGLLHGMVSRRARRAVPLGTWLAVGIWLTWLYGPLAFP